MILRSSIAIPLLQSIAAFSPWGLRCPPWGRRSRSARFPYHVLWEDYHWQQSLGWLGARCYSRVPSSRVGRMGILNVLCPCWPPHRCVSRVPRCRAGRAASERNFCPAVDAVPRCRGRHGGGDSNGRGRPRRSSMRTRTRGGVLVAAGNGTRCRRQCGLGRRDPPPPPPDAAGRKPLRFAVVSDADQQAAASCAKAAQLPCHLFLHFGRFHEGVLPRAWPQLELECPGLAPWQERANRMPEAPALVSGPPCIVAARTRRARRRRFRLPCPRRSNRSDAGKNEAGKAPPVPAIPGPPSRPCAGSCRCCTGGQRRHVTPQGARGRRRRGGASTPASAPTLRRAEGPGAGTDATPA